MVALTYNPKIWEAEAENYYEFKAILGYIVNSRPARASEKESHHPLEVSPKLPHSES